MKSWTPIILVASVVAGLAARSAAPPPRPSIAGTWTLDREHSAFPTDVAFNLPPAFVNALNAPQATGRSRGGGGTPMPVVIASEDDTKREHQLLAEVKSPPATLTIAETDGLITITAANGRARAFHPGTGKEDFQDLEGVTVGTTAKWNGGKLEITYAVEKDRVVHYRYWRTDDRAPLIVEASPRDHGKGDVITRVYTTGR
jgi:hypothetical protein